MIRESDLTFKLQCLSAMFYQNRAMFVCVYMYRLWLLSATAVLSHCDQGCLAHKVKGTAYIVLYRKSVLTSDLDQDAQHSHCPGRLPGNPSSMISSPHS